MFTPLSYWYFASMIALDGVLKAVLSAPLTLICVMLPKGSYAKW